MKHFLQSLDILFVVISIFAMTNPSTGKDFSVWPGSVEKPPVEYSEGPYSAKTIFIDDFKDVDSFCKNALGPLPFNAIYLGCYIPNSDTIIAPTQNGDYVRKAILIHEQAHARGWRHFIQ